jgi:hypothetical protein
MIRPFLFLTSFLASALWAQSAPQQAANQQPDWIGVPGSTTVTVHITKPDGQTGPVLEKPFSATEVRQTQQTLGDGTHVNHTENSKFYRDAQGRMRDEATKTILIFDPVAGHTYNLDLASKSYTEDWAGYGNQSTTIVSSGNGTWVNTQDKIDPSLPIQTAHQGHVPYHAEPVRNYETEDLGVRIVNGVSCKGSRTTMIIPVATLGNDRDIKIVDERWFSPDLGALVKSSNSDPRFGVTSYDLTNIVQAAPDEKLFELPAGYTLKQYR